jgi:hypothetical protein
MFQTITKSQDKNKASPKAKQPNFIVSNSLAKNLLSVGKKHAEDASINNYQYLSN